MAAGMEMEETKYEQFRQLFNQAVETELKGKNPVPIQMVNAWIKLSDVSDANFKALEKLSPFGQNNPKPVFAARGVKVAGSPRVVGKKHLRFSVSDGKTTVGAIVFNRAEGATSPAGRNVLNGEIDLAFQIRKNSFNGSENLELNVLDFRKTCPASEE